MVDNDTNQVRALYTANAGTEGMTDSFKFQGTSSGGEVGNEVTRNTNNVANTDDVPVCQGNNFLMLRGRGREDRGLVPRPRRGGRAQHHDHPAGHQRHGGRR